ncbi:Ig-like domain-containing protein [Nocardioides sp.]|uniref:Ig-like domain-containing protein n=1 Tax=Nocardioides sp. TaxID=35761 RepID=UPI00356758A9
MKKHTISSGLTLVLISTLTAATIPFGASPAAANGALTLVATSADGPAFDVDEYAVSDGDISVQVSDGAGDVDVDDAQDLNYHWDFTPFDSTAATVRVPATGEDLQAIDVAGRFEVPLPSEGSGTYVLTADLSADGGGANAVPASEVLTVKAGEATLSLDPDDPWFVPAGTDAPLAGTLLLEDGTGLPDRLIDLDFTRGTAGTDPEADAGFVPAAPGPLVTTLQVTTDTDGAFAAVVSDPAEDGQGTELGGSIDAATAATPDVGDADADAMLAIDLVSTNPPAGSTMALSNLGDGKPGEALSGDLTITAPDDTFDTDPGTPGVQGDAGTDPDPVEGQVVELSLDHGFFTDGAPLPSTVGEPAHDLTDLGATMTAVTDANGKVAFEVGIGRDTAFDTSTVVTATLDAVAGDLSEQGSADWDSTDPFSGGEVQIVLSPPSEQENPVDPAVAGDRVYYDVFATDQFGNPVVGEPVYLDYSGNLDDWDYDVDYLETDLDRSGDLWIVSFEAAEITIEGTWNAPTTTYTDTVGGTTSGTADITGSATVEWYELDFGAAKFSLRSSPRGKIAINTPVTQIVRVIDHMGNPVRGYQVRFFRNGPDSQLSEPRATRITNKRGEAFYTFVGTAVGKAKITAEVNDGVDIRTLSKTVRFGLPVNAKLRAVGSAGGKDVVKVKADRVAAGAVVKLFRVVRGKLKAAGKAKLNKSGNAVFSVRDRNKAKRTAYIARVSSRPTTVSATTNTLWMR